MTDITRIRTLEALIKKHQHLYYNAEPEISDAEFDALWEELRTLAPADPLFAIVPADAADGFAKALHIIPMGSQEKAANPESFEKWASKMPFSDFLVQYKLDGASLELQYENGLFVKAVTRGDGKIGDDITENVKKMSGFVPVLRGKTDTAGSGPFTGGVRGEVIMKKAIHAAHYADKANCRNAANGLMKRKDGSGCEHLTIICYDAVAGTQGKPFSLEAPFHTEIEKLTWLKAQGFETVPVALCSGVRKVIDYRAHIMDIRDTIVYDIDGLVIKTNSIDPADLARPRPEKQIAFKFSLEEAVTVLRSVEWSESGVTYTPIAVTDPVRLAGTTVKRANLCNPNMIQSLHLKIGSKVVITKRGEIIPKIEALVENPPASMPIEQPVVCTVCNTALIDEGTRLYCPNPACPKILHHRLEKWISTLDIQDFGIQLIKQLFCSQRLHTIADLYTLTIDELSTLDRMGQKSAEKVYRSLHTKRDIPLAVFIAGLDIEGIGQTMVEKLIEAGFDTLEKITTAREEDFASVYQFGAVLAKNLVQGVNNLRDEIAALTDSGIITIISPEKRGSSVEVQPLHGKSFCFTGELHSLKRKEAEALVKEKGGSVKSAVSKGLTFLVTNTPHSGSSKNKKAQELGTAIITEEAFLDLVHS
ncbi:MAG: NAD-dependent DNA ligase LigA [Treponema sp.]